LDALVNRSLLSWVDRAGGNVRYRLHALLHDYAIYLLRASHLESAGRLAHAGCFLHYAQDHSDQTPEDYQALDLELANLRLALGTLDRIGAYSDYIDLTLAVQTFFEVRGYWREGRAFLLRAEELNQILLPTQDPAKWTRSQAALERGLGMLAYDLGEYAAAKKYLQKSQQNSRKVKDLEGRRKSLYNLALVYADERRFTKALKLLQRVETLAQKKPKARPAFWIALKQQLSKCYMGLERFPEAQDQLEECLTLHERHPEAGDNHLAYTHYFLGMLNFFQNRFDEAGEHYRQALETHQKLGNRAGIVECSADLAEVAIYKGQLKQARELMDDALAIAIEAGYTGLEKYIRGDLETLYQNPP
jgi:tetratricopeptide (TPR) repeat protein